MLQKQPPLGPTGWQPSLLSVLFFPHFLCRSGSAQRGTMNFVFHPPPPPLPLPTPPPPRLCQPVTSPEACPAISALPQGYL